ncbi:ATPase inhibitor; mitochondrial [Camelus dromedarius]|uniref:ATPase inhibitor n=1 Tax=Camelus dromedarius TaxID=9838 RepID=A0A5N4C2I6_CAMDR|nr:ATPase inhibitor; mitochondrial [Camelus dromedarius]
MFIAALFTIAKTWKQPKCPSTEDWIKKPTKLGSTLVIKNKESLGGAARASLTAMAAKALAVRTRFSVWSVWAMGSRGFSSDPPDNVCPSEGAVQDVGGAFGKREQAEEERNF